MEFNNFEGGINYPRSEELSPEVEKLEELPPVDDIETGNHIEQSVEHLDQKIAQTLNKINSLGNSVASDSSDFLQRPIVDNKISLTDEERVFVLNKINEFKQEVKGAKVAITVGYKVEADYDAQVQGWTTQSKVVEMPDGNRIFVLYSYPQGKLRRISDRFMEFLSGDKMHKPWSKDWKRIVEEKSNIPVFADTPDNMVAMPFIKSINAYDLFAHQKDIKDFGDFDWAEGISVEERLELLPAVTQELERVHQSGKAWGESTLMNFIFTLDKKPILVDSETSYSPEVDLVEAQATDLRNFIVSVCGSLNRSESYTDFENIVRRIFSNYGNEEVKSKLKEMAKAGISKRQRMFFNLFSRFRIGATDLKEFDKVLVTIGELSE